MDPLITSALIAGGSSLLGGIMGSRQADRQNRFWANYNSPVEQMKRLSAAGLNPNLVYQNGNALVEAKPTADTSAPLMQGVSQAGRAYQDAIMRRQELKIQSRLADSQITKNTEDANKSREEARKARIEADALDNDDYKNQYSFINKLRSHQASYYATEEEKLKAEKTYIEYNAERARIEKEIADTYGRQEAEQSALIKQFEANMAQKEDNAKEAFIALEKELKRSNINLNNKEMAKLGVDMAYYTALQKESEERKKKIFAETKTERQRKKLLEKDTRLRNLEAEMAQIKKDYAKKGLNFDHMSETAGFTTPIFGIHATTTGDARAMYKSNPAGGRKVTGGHGSTITIPN